MAKKKDDELKFGQLPYPTESDSYRTMRVNWAEFNKRQNLDTGAISYEKNISTLEYPYLTPSQSRRDILQNKLDSWKDYTNGYNHPLSLFTFGDYLIVIYRVDKYILADYLTLTNHNSDDEDNKYNGEIDKRYSCLIYTYESASDASKHDEDIHSMCQFRVYSNVSDPISGTFIDKLLVFPEKVSLPFKIVTVNDKSEINDTTLTYCIYEGGRNHYYIYDGEIYREITRTNSIDDDWCADSVNKIQVFEASKLDVTVIEYYSDGFRRSPDETYNDGYTQTEYSYYNDGYQKYTGSISSDFAEVYYKRSNDVPYTYSSITITGAGVVTGTLYKPVSGGYPLTKDIVFYKRTGSGPYTYTKVTDLEYGDDISRYFVLSDENAVDRKYYKRGEYDESTGSYTYKEVKKLDHGDDVSKYYILSDPSTSTSSEVEGETENNDVITSGSVSFAINDKVFEPPAGSDKTAYYFNSFTSMTYQYVDGEWLITVPPSFPDLKYVTVYASRLFGVDDDRVYVSGYNDYANWQLDNIDDYKETNAWVTVSQASVETSSNFTGITTYGGHVVCFKRNYQQEIYNTKNPFNIVDIGTSGALNNKCITEVANTLIFVSNDNINIYTGSVPKTLGYQLNIENISYAVTGADDRQCYVYLEDAYHYSNLYIYDSATGAWSEQEIENRVIGFCHNNLGMFMLDETGHIFKLNTNEYDIDWSFETDLATVLSASSRSSYQSVDIKHLRKLQIFAYIDKGSYFKVYAIYNDKQFDENKSQLLFDSTGLYGQRAIRVKPRMTANYAYKLRFEGHGYVRLYYMELMLTPGGQLFTEGSGFLNE